MNMLLLLFATQFLGMSGLVWYGSRRRRPSVCDSRLQLSHTISISVGDTFLLWTSKSDYDLLLRVAPLVYNEDEIKY